MGIPLDDIASPSANTAWDPEVGDTVVGTITFADLLPPRLNYNRTARERVMRIDLDGTGGRKWTLWPVVNSDVDGEGYPSRMARVIREAVDKAGASELEVGGRLALIRVDDVPPTQAGRSPAKNFEAQYQAPVPAPKAVSLADMMGGTAPTPAAPEPEPAARPAPKLSDLLGG